MYYQYRLAKGDTRDQEKIYDEGQKCLSRIRERGVPIAEGYGQNLWDLNPELDQEVHRLYDDAKVSLWTAMTPAFVAAIPTPVAVITRSKDRKDYVYHPESGEQLSAQSIETLTAIRNSWENEKPDVQIIISDGLNARALMDEGHLMPYLNGLAAALKEKKYRVSKENIVITHGRVRAGYSCGEVLFGAGEHVAASKGIIHIIGERPGSGHHNFSAYLTAASPNTWNKKGTVDHDISRVVSGISDTSLKPDRAIKDTLRIFDQLYANA